MNSSNKQNYILHQVLSVVLVIFFSVVLVNLIDIQSLKEESVLLLNENGGLGIPIYLLGNSLLYLLLIPSTVLGAAAGVIFGLGEGIIIYAFSCFFASLIIFLIVRVLLKDRIQSIIEKKDNLNEAQSLIVREGIRFLFLVRFLPIHATIINTILSVSSISISKFLVSCLFLIPEWVLHVYIGYVASLTTQNAIQKGLIIEDYYRIISLIISIIAITYLGWIAQKVIRKSKARTEKEKLSIINQTKLNN